MTIYGRSEELVSWCVECDLAEPESLASLGGSSPGLVDGILSHLKYRTPALFIPRRHEAVATDTVYSDTPAVDSGVKMAQCFAGKDSLVSDIYPMRFGKQFVNTLENNIRRGGAMDKLISDSAKTEISHKVKDILRAYIINDWQSEPYRQNQNPAEWLYRIIKAWLNTIVNRTGAPVHCWLLTLQYVGYILNHISTASLGGQVLF